MRATFMPSREIGFSLPPRSTMRPAAKLISGSRAAISQSQRTIAWTAKTPPKIATPLAFDQRHRFTLNMDYRLGQSEGPTVHGSHWFENAGVNVLADGNLSGKQVVDGTLEDAIRKLVALGWTTDGSGRFTCPICRERGDVRKTPRGRASSAAP